MGVNRTILSGIILFFSLVIGMFLTWPRYQDFSFLNSQLRAKKEELQNKEQYFANLSSLQATLDDSAEKLKRIDAAIPNSANLPSLYNSLEKDAAASGLVLRTISSTAPKSTGGANTLQPIALTLELTGSYNALKEFLLLLQTSPRLILLDSLTLAKSKEGTSFLFTFHLNAYSY